MKQSNSCDVINGQALLQSLRDRGVELWIDNGALRYRAPKGQITIDRLTALCRSDSTLLSQLVKREAARLEPYVRPRPADVSAPLGFSQLGHWLMRAAANHRPLRQVASATRLQGNLDIGALKEALSGIVSRHEALRTRIVVRKGEPVQEIMMHGGCDVQEIDLTTIPSDARPREVQRQITSAIFDVANYALDPLFAVTLIHLGADEHVLVLALDHVVSDGASLSIVFDDLVATHAHLTSGTPLSLPPVQMQLADYATWQRTELAGWLGKYAPGWTDLPRIRFPEDVRLPDSTGWGFVRFVIDTRRKHALHEWARYQKTSLVMTVLSIYVAVVRRWCETSDVIIQFTSDGRLSRLLEHTVGDVAFCLNLRISCEAGLTFVDLAKRVTAEYCRAIEMHDFGYAYVQPRLPELVRNTCFNWIPERTQGEAQRSASPPVLTLSEMTFDHPALDVLDWDGEPMMTFREMGSQVVGELSFPRKRFSYSTMGRFADDFTQFLDALLATRMRDIRDIA